MKNLSAFTEKNQLIEIDDVIKNGKEKYYCVNCAEELIARKGKINAHHFSHKNQLNCSFESYLHKLGKIKFHQAYTESLESGQPYFVEYSTKRTCNSCETFQDVNVTCHLNDKIEKFDLTKIFDQIHIEKAHSGFVADILLTSSKTDDVLFIEIAVTHKCELDKRLSGIKIVEINIIREQDLNFLKEKKLKLNQPNLDFYNFKKAKLKKEFHRKLDCKMPFEVFVILKNGKAIKRFTRMYEIARDFQNKEYIHFQILSENEDRRYENQDNYAELIRELSDEGIKVKNCYACRFSTKNTAKHQSYSLFCKKLRAEIQNSNNGSECEKFWRLEKPTPNNAYSK